jgi:hypothetical protein
MRNRFAILLSSALFFFFFRCHGVDLPNPAEQSFRWTKQSDSWVLKQQTETVGTLIPASEEGLVSEDKIVPLETGVFRVSRTYVNRLNSQRDGVRLTLDFVVAARADFALIPSVLYNGNTWGKGGEPKNWRHDGRWWSFSYTRTPIPGATFSQNERYSVALWGEPERCRDGFSCSLIPEEDATTHRLIWPEEEQPLSYSSRDHFSKGWAKSLSLAPGENYTVSAVLVVDTAKANPLRSESRFLETAWALLKRPTAPALSPEAVWACRVRFAKESLWAEEAGFHGFSIGLLPGGDEWRQRTAGKYEIGWCGQNASLANSLLADYLRTRDTNSLNKGLAALDSWAAGAVLSNGLFAVHYDDILAGQKEFTVDACNLGTAALNYFEAYELAKRCGFERASFRQLSFGICDFALRAQELSGEFGKAWNNHGECIDRNGTVGAWLVLPLLRAYEVSRRQEFLVSARRGYEFYMSEFLDNGFSSAGALDTTCVDKESAMSLLRASILLYRTTRERRYLQQAEDVSNYLSTWLWHYSAEFPESSELRRLGWDTFGCSSVSAQHHHLDPYAVYWVNDWLELAELTGHAIWREKAVAIWNNSTHLVSDGRLKVFGRQRPVGSQNEAFFETYWGDGRGQPNDWLVAWPAAFQLETLRHLKDWSVIHGAADRR